MKNFPSLKERGLTLLINTLVAYVVFIAASSQWLPTGGLESVWLISAISFWFLSLLSAPWFVPPRDALISAIGALLVLTTIDFEGVPEFSEELNSLRWVFVAYCLVVVSLSVIALFLHDGPQKSAKSQLAFRITGILGRGEVLFTAPALLSILGSYQQSYPTIAWLVVFWIAISVIRPVEKIAAVIRQYHEDTSKVPGDALVGTVDRVDHPNIVRVKLASSGAWPLNRLYTASMRDGTQQFVVSLFSQVQGSEVVGTGLCVGVSADPIQLETGCVLATHDEAKTREYLETLSGAPNSELVGFVVENSTISVIIFEIASSSELQEGSVVFIRIGGKDVFYQIVGAETAEENFDANPRGTQLVRAAQLGVYFAEKGFQKYSWLPQMNKPIFSAGSKKFDDAVLTEREFEIGIVPSTNVKAIAKIDELVEFHTAILGVTGTGKTELALDIVREATSKGVKAFCVDFTGDYRARLSDLTPIFPAPDPEKAKSIEGLLATIDAYGFKAGDQKKRLRALLDEIRADTKAAIDAFLTDENCHLAIFELAEISNSKAGLRLTEIYLSAIMNWAREHRRARQIVICLEEAHTIVPEAFGSGFDGDTKWVVT